MLGLGLEGVDLVLFDYGYLVSLTFLPAIIDMGNNNATIGLNLLTSPLRCHKLFGQFLFRWLLFILQKMVLQLRTA